MAGDIRLARGKLLMQVGAFERARNDLTIVWEERHGDRAVERLLVELEQRAGDYRAALLRIMHLIELDGTHAEDWRTKGELHRAAAEKAISQCKEVLSKVLVPENAGKATVLLDRAAALDPKDPRRVSIGHDMRDLFEFTNEDQAERALSTADAASRDMADARAALAHSLVLAFDATRRRRVQSSPKSPSLSSAVSSSFVATSCRQRERLSDTAAIGGIRSVCINPAASSTNERNSRKSAVLEVESSTCGPRCSTRRTRMSA